MTWDVSFEMQIREKRLLKRSTEWAKNGPFKNDDIESRKLLAELRLVTIKIILIVNFLKIND